MQTKRWFYTGAWLGTLALLSACGGGDDAAQAGQPVALSAQNEATLSVAAVRQVSTLQGVVDFGSGLTGSDTAIARASVGRALKTVMTASRVGALATTSDRVDCDSGSFTVERADDLSTVSLRFAACQDAGVTTDGALTLSRVSISQNGLQQVYDAKVDVSTTEGTTIDKLQGDFRLSLDRSTAGQDIAELSSTVLSFERRTGIQVVESLKLRGLQQKSVLSDTGARTETFSFTADGSLNLLGNSAYKVETLTALATPETSTDPASGQVKITVAGKGIILLTVEANRVHVQVDVEGNGSFEVDRFQTWSSLSGLTSS